MAEINEDTMLKFCANLSFMFTEYPFLERYKAAKSAGFTAVESGFPYGIDEAEVIRAREQAGVQQVLVNTFTGDVTRGELGYAATPGKEIEFRESLERTLNLAKSLGAGKVHVMAGIVTQVAEENHQTYENNMILAARLLEQNGIVGLIEPINANSVPGYYLNSYQRALDVLEKTDSANLKLLLDVFHMQQITGNLTDNIKRLSKYIGHVQIAQVPDRHEPDTVGELDLVYVLKTLRNNGYNDWIGLEYKPAGDTVQGLKWIERYRELFNR